MVRKRRTEGPSGGESSDYQYGRSGDGGVGGGHGVSSSLLPKPTKLEQPMGQMVIHSEATAHSSKSSMSFPLRPGKGSYGTKCVVKANHFLVELLNKDLHQYDVTITPKVTSRCMNHDVMEQLVRLYRESHLGKRLPAYGGGRRLYTAGPLPFVSEEFRITLIDDDEGVGVGGQRRDREFKVLIKFVTQIDLHHLELFLQGSQTDDPQAALQALDIILRGIPTMSFLL